MLQMKWKPGFQMTSEQILFLNEKIKNKLFMSKKILKKILNKKNYEQLFWANFL
jgi:hypothetical protein